MVTTQPRAQSFIIKRPRLTKLLDESGARILLLFAPAGYGKTTLAREWIEGRDDVVWYAGGPAMADVAALAVGLAEALTGSEEVTERVRMLAANGQPTESLAKVVAGGAVEPRDSTLVIDDYQYVAESTDAEVFLTEFLRLTSVRLLLTSRVRPHWVTPRMDVYGEALVLDMNALAFTDDEVAEVLHDVEMPILAYARGWPAVVGLAARRGDFRDPRADPPPRDLYEFFAEDIFQTASPALKEGLFLLALGADASPTVARNVLGTEYESLVADAIERGMLSRVGKTSVSVHPLLKGFLHTRLGEFPNNEIDAMVGRVVCGLADAKHWDECLAALRRFPSPPLIASTLCVALNDLLSSGRVSTLKQWIDLARSHDLDDPIFLLAEAELALRAGDERRAQTLAERSALLLSALAPKFAHVSGGEGCGVVGVRLGEQPVEVLARERPLEGRGDLFVATAEGQ